MDKSALELAAIVVREASRSKPADAVLRSALKSQRALSRESAALVSRAVFAYYRWRGWLGGNTSSAAIELALQMADRFKVDPERFSDQELVERAFPAWACDEVELTPALARALQAEPKLWLRARPGQGRVVCKKLGHCRQFGVGALADSLQYLGTADLFRDTEFQRGRFEIQDISSQAVGFICAPKPGESWWDACAGEGGKTLHLSDLMGNKGLIWASDQAEWRLKSLKRRAARAGVFNYRAATWKGGSRLPSRTLFDGVLVDAPCSGVGTWQRNPHARWTTTLHDIAELGVLQAQLLAHAAAAVKRGGKLIYSVCTLTRCETLAVVAQFEREFPMFATEAAANPLLPQNPPVEKLWLYPQDFGGAGMFVAQWRRQV